MAQAAARSVKSAIVATLSAVKRTHDARRPIATGPNSPFIYSNPGMKFSLLGQLKGPECRRVIQQAIELRKTLEPWFETVEGGNLAELAVVLRVDGSLGSFGPEGVENIAIEDGTIECDLFIADRGWADRRDEEIASVLRAQVLQ